VAADAAARRSAATGAVVTGYSIMPHQPAPPPDLPNDVLDESSGGEARWCRSKSVRPELRALTSVRGIAAWLVVLYHIRLSMAFAPRWLIAIFAKGYLAVDFFFLLSGFVIWLTYGERLRREGLAGAPAFLKRRIARVWPLHLFMLAGAAALALLLLATGHGAPRMFPFAQLPLHVLMIQDWGLTDGLAWNVPAWSISAELAAYLLFPLLTLAVDWRRLPTPVIVGVLALLFGLLHAVMAWAGAATLGHSIARLGVVRCLAEFTAGTALCALWLRWAEQPVRWAFVSGALALALFAGWLAGLLPETLAIAPAFAAALMALALTSGLPGNPLEAGWLHHLGEISYATYLSHFLLYFAFKLAMVDDPYDVPPVLIALFLALVLGSSIALYHLVERPTQRAINRWRWPIPPMRDTVLIR
jgi:peptidoglycan/LPS O-acetylase OafA/YrhL